MNRYAVRLVMPAVGLLMFASSAVAGPPLLCHPFDIGAARSLPWDGSRGWSHGRSDYNVQRLIADTQALLTPSTPVIVRMETLRRAALYASDDGRVAAGLLDTLRRRAHSLALFDAGYYIETLKQIGHLGQSGEFRARAETVAPIVSSIDGYALMTRAMALSPDNPALEFAAALVTASNDRRAYAQHAEKARKGVAKDALLARNIDQIS
jgi:hypothetical protein